MHFSRSLAGVALLGVFAAMAFAGAATGAPAQSEQSAVSQVTSLTGEKLQLEKMGVRALSPVGGKAPEKNPYKAVRSATRRGTCSGPARTATFRRSSGPGAVVQGSVGRERNCCCNR